LLKQRAEESGLKPLYALRPLRRRQLHRLLLCLLRRLLLLCLLRRLLLLCLLRRLLLLCLLHRLLLLFPARLTCRRYLRLELFADRFQLLLDLLPHGLPEVLVERCQNRVEGLR
jgi:hypothetical protein